MWGTQVLNPRVPSKETLEAAQTAARFCANVHASLDTMLGALETQLYEPRLSDYLEPQPRPQQDLAQQDQLRRKKPFNFWEADYRVTTWRQRHSAYESRLPPSTRDSGSSTLKRLRAGGLHLSERRWDVLRIKLVEWGESLHDGTVNVTPMLERNGTVSCGDRLPEL